MSLKASLLEAFVLTAARGRRGLDGVCPDGCTERIVKVTLLLLRILHQLLELFL